MKDYGNDADVEDEEVFDASNNEDSTLNVISITYDDPLKSETFTQEK